MENKFSTNLKNLRKKNNFTLQTLGKALNISKSAISDYENGKSSPSFEVCEKIADFFGIAIDELRISEMSENKTNKGIGTLADMRRSNSENSELLVQKNQLELQNKLLNQQLSGLDIQLKLVNQIVESKNSEIKSLQMQIRLLEEKLSDFKTTTPSH